MSTSDFILGPLPTSERRRELWVQHATETGKNDPFRSQLLIGLVG
jgi:hypothetical protein